MDRVTIKLVTDLMYAVRDELDACGEEEVQQHSLLKAHSKVVERARKWLTKQSTLTLPETAGRLRPRLYQAGAMRAETGKKCLV
jgi:hypothetical protein